MSYVTMPVQIADGRIVVDGCQPIPRNGPAILLIPAEGAAPVSHIGTSDLSDVELAISETWDQLGPAPDIDYDKL